MYWYYKYPLMAISALLAAGIFWLVLKPTTPKPAPAAKVPAVVSSGTPMPLPPPKTPETKAAPETPTPPAVAEAAKPESAKPAPAPVAQTLPAPTAIPAPAPAFGQHTEALAAARTLLEQERYEQARAAAAAVLEAAGVALFSDTWQEAADIVSTANTKFISSNLKCPEKRPYTVQKGEMLIRIAYKNGTTVEQIKKNNPSMRVIQPGQVLQLLPGEGFSLVAYKSQFTLLLLHNGKLFKTYPISIGRENRTPVGTFVIDDKMPEPPFRDIPYTGNGDQGNELGTRWLRLKPTAPTPDTLVGYGIHGTWEPDSIGKAASNGCLRLSNADVEELYDLIPLKPGLVNVEIKE